MMRKLFAFLMAAMLLALCACSGTDTSGPADNSGALQGDDSSGDAAEVQYNYQLKAGETTEVYDVTFDEMVTVTVDSASTRMVPLICAVASILTIAPSTAALRSWATITLWSASGVAVPLGMGPS